MKAPYPLWAGASFLKEACGALPCREIRQKFWVRRWRAERGNASRGVGMGGKRRTFTAWEGDLVMRICGCQHLLPAGPEAAERGAAGEGDGACSAW